MKQNREKELLKNTAIITVGRVSTQFISFLLLPLYTALLSTEEYGIVDLITTLVQLIIPVFSLMIDQSVFRYLLSCKFHDEKSKVISSAVYVLTGLAVAFTLVYTSVCYYFDFSYKIWLLLILIVTAYSNLYLQVARGLKQTTDYAIGSFVCSASTIVANVVFIVLMQMGARGMLFATFLGNAICCLFLFFKLKIYKYLSFSIIDKKTTKNELTYSIPLIPNQLSLWVMNSSDRIIVTLILGTAANGVLAVSHKFSAIFMTFYNIFQLAWHETGAVHYFDEDRDIFFSNMFEKVIFISSTLCLGIIVVLPLVFNWFVNSEYHEAYNNIPIYLIASLFNIVVGFLGVAYVATRKTSEIAKTTIMAAVINIVVNFILIRFVGLYAASISTFIGYLVTMIYRIVDTKKYLKIRYNIKQYILIVAALVICFVVYYLENKIISFIFLPIFLAVAFWLNRVSLKKLVTIMKKKMVE